MSQKQPTIELTQNAEYRDGYSNSVQVRMSVWDFHLVFGTMQQESPEMMKFVAFQGVYLSPQQAKALLQVLGQNLAQYEQDFGPIALQPHVIAPNGPIH
jgi:flagellar protein FlaG